MERTLFMDREWGEGIVRWNEGEKEKEREREKSGYLCDHLATLYKEQLK